MDAVRCCVSSSDGTPCPNAATLALYCPQHQDQRQFDLEILKLASDHFKQDLREFWTRSNFYLVADAALVSVFVQSSSDLKRSLAAFGLLISAFWFVVARGAIQWIRAWRGKVRELDVKVDRLRVYDDVEARVHTRPWSSPSWVTQWLPLCFILGWIVLIIIG